MGLGPEATDYKLSGVLTYQAVTGDVKGYYATALTHRPDLAEIEDQARAEGAKITQYRSDFTPTVNAVAGYNALGTGSPAANNYDAGILIDWPIFNGFETEHQITAARFHREALKHQIEDLRQRIYLEVKSSFLDWQASHRANSAQGGHGCGFARAARTRHQTLRCGIGEHHRADGRRTFLYIEDDAAYIDALYGYAVTKAALDLATGSSSLR